MAIKATWERREWAAALGLLRKGPAFFVPQHVAFLRAYSELGRPAAALAFTRHARHIDPGSTTYRLMELDTLAATGELDDATSLAWRYVGDVAERPAVVLAASGLLISPMADRAENGSRVAMAKLSAILRGTVDRLPGPDGDPHGDDLLATARVQLGACLDGVNPGSALTAYQSAIQSAAFDVDGVITRAQLADYVRQPFATNANTVAAQ